MFEVFLFPVLSRCWSSAVWSEVWLHPRICGWFIYPLCLLLPSSHCCKSCSYLPSVNLCLVCGEEASLVWWHGFINFCTNDGVEISSPVACRKLIFSCWAQCRCVCMTQLIHQMNSSLLASCYMGKKTIPCLSSVVILKLGMYLSTGADQCCRPLLLFRVLSTQDSLEASGNCYFGHPLVGEYCLFSFLCFLVEMRNGCHKWQPSGWWLYSGGSQVFLSDRPNSSILLTNKLRFPPTA